MSRPANPSPPAVASAESALEPLLTLAHELGSEARSLAILGEGNVSMRATPRAGAEAGETGGGSATFFVKASGSSLATLSAEGLTECRAGYLITALDSRAMGDAEVEAALLASRVAGEAARKPSVEAMFHAWLLTLPGVNFVGHTHPVAVNAILCCAISRRIGFSPTKSCAAGRRPFLCLTSIPGSCSLKKSAARCSHSSKSTVPRRASSYSKTTG